MALTSPGVEVTVIDESFYTPAEPGTTALLAIATAQDKINAAGTATAVGTTAANAGVVYRITSQRELLDTFGVPFFEKTVTNTPVHGSERNEYGLLSAYSLLGVTNSVFVVRAGVDLDELAPQTSAPGAEPDDGKWWVNTTTTTWGIQEWDGAAASTSGGQRFSAKTPTVLTDSDASKITSNVPKASYGSIGDYAVVFETGTTTKENAKIYYKSAGNGGSVFPVSGTTVDAGAWVLLGSPEWVASHPVIISSTAVTGATLTPGDSVVINGTTVTNGGSTVATLASAINSASIEGVTANAISGTLYLYSDGTSSAAADSTFNGAISIAAGTGSILTSIGITAGTYYCASVKQAPHTQVPAFKSSDTYPRPTGSVWVKTTEPNQGARWRVSRWSSSLQVWEAFDAPLYRNTAQAIYYLDRSGGGVNIPVGSIYVQFNASEDDKEIENAAVAGGGTAQFRVWRRVESGETVIRSSEVTASTFASGSNTFTVKEMLKGELELDAAKTVSFTATGAATDADLMAAAINAAGFSHIEGRVTDDNEVEIVHKTGGDFRLTDGTSTPIADAFGSGFNVVSLTGTSNYYALPADADDDYLATNWRPLISDDFSASGSQPLNEAQDGQLWYNPNFGEVDIMVHNGNTWIGYKNSYANTDPNGPIVAASEPTTQSDGTALVDNDLWISTADLENFPIIYRRKFTGTTEEGWYQVDTTDQTTEEGVLFADARWRDESGNSTTPDGAGDADTIISLLTSNFLDTDAPDPDLYPKGMLLYNLRRSGGNVKRYANGYINTGLDNDRYDGTNSLNGDAYVSGQSMTNYATDRWVTYSANNEDGSGSFGRNAQRKVVVAALKSVLDTSEQARDTERRNFNLISCPGYPETLSNMVNLNIDRGYTSFVIGDTPLRLPSNATALLNYGTNASLVTDNGDDGIVTYDEYCAVYYPNGFTTDLGGSNAVVPASHMMLRTMTLSDQVSYPWFAPAGTRRGGITNATSVGYIDSLTGEFQTVALNEGQRDTLYDLKINPIPFFVGVGLVAYGQKTRARNASALDRINVARLVVYLRSQLNKLARPYVFEPNDKIIRDEIKGAVESLLLELVSLRAIYDFAVVCDETNNTPSRIDRNELYVDIAIEPVKAVEFIYIPLRVQNTGEI